MSGAFFFGGADPADAIIATALVDLNSDGISGDGATIEWVNAGLGGSGYDMDTPLGTTGNLSTTTVNGQTVITSSGSARIESAAGQSITDALTVIAVAKFDPANPTNNPRLLSSRSLGTDRLDLFPQDSSADRFSVYAGVALVLSEAYSTDPHVWVVQSRKDATSSLTVDGVGTATGSIGSQNFDYMTLFDYASAIGMQMDGWIGRVLIWDDGGISDDDAQLVINKLNSDFGIS